MGKIAIIFILQANCISTNVDKTGIESGLFGHLITFVSHEQGSHSNLNISGKFRQNFQLHLYKNVRQIIFIIENTLIVGILRGFNPDIHVIETGQNGLQLHIANHYGGSASNPNTMRKRAIKFSITYF